MATTTNYSWSTPDDTALVKDGAAAIRSLGTAIDTTVFTNAGAAIAKSIVDAKGDLIAGTADNTVARLASSGSNGNVLTVDTSTATGLAWTAPAGGGKVLQVVSTTYSTRKDVTSTTYTDTDLSLSITPSSATSKVLVLVTHNIYVSETGNNPDANIRLMRGATAILNNIDLSTANGSFKYSGIATAETNGVSWSYLDSPATTSATTYKTQMAVKNTANSSQISTNVRAGSDSTITLLEIGA